MFWATELLGRADLVVLRSRFNQLLGYSKRAYSCGILVRDFLTRRHGERGGKALTISVLLGVLFLRAAFALAQDKCERIVSLAPSVTELLFSTELGKNVVGVTRFCKFPAEVKTLPKVGGFLDPSLEAIVALQPSVVMLLKEQEDVSIQLQRFKIKTLLVDHRSIDGILKSYSEIGTFCNASEKVQAINSELTNARESARKLNHDKQKLRVLVVVGRTADNGRLKSVFISGKDGYYSELLQILSAENANSAGTVAIPVATPEGILALNPDAIIEIVDQEEYQKESVEDLIKAWDSFSLLPAARSHNILILREDYASIPGPRFPQLLSKLQTFLDSVREKNKATKQ